MLFYLMAVSCYTTNPYSMYSGLGYNLYSGPYLGVNPYYVASNNSYSNSSTPTKKEENSEEVKQKENSSNDDSDLKMTCLMCNGTGVFLGYNMICSGCGGTGYMKLRINLNAIANDIQVNSSTTNNLPVISSPSNTQPNNTNNSTILQENHQREKCWNCHGKGRVIKDINVATFGNDEKKWCQECQSWYYRSNAHTHVNCSICHGTGYVK